jgi:hypothetical protein
MTDGGGEVVWPFDEDLPRSSADIERLEGDPYSVRLCASDLRSLAGGLDTAWTATSELQSIGDGTSWNGAGFDAYRAQVEKNPKPTDVANAQRTMGDAADVLDGLASGIADCQSRIDWCRQRLDGLGVPQDGDIPEELRPQVEAIRDDANQAREDYDRHFRDAGDRFGEMTDQTVYAEPPPGILERAADFVGDALEFVGEFAIGIVEGVWEMVKGLYSIVSLIVQPWKWDDAWRTLTQIVQFAIENPGEFFKAVGKAIVDWDTLMTNPGRWLGKLVPNIALAILTGGAGTAATVASRIAVMSARFGRVSRVANKAAKVSTQIDRRFRATNLARRHNLMEPLSGEQASALRRRAGTIGEDLSRQSWQNRGYGLAGEQVTLRSVNSLNANGRPVTARVDLVFTRPDGSPHLVEAKNGLNADLTDNQRIVYPELPTTGAEVRTDKLADVGVPRGSHIQTDVQVDRWYSPADAPSVGQQVAVQAGAEGVQTAGDDQRFPVPPDR